MKCFKHWHQGLTALSVATALPACKPTPTPLTEQESQNVTTLTANMTPRCVGRYLVDMPERFVLNSEGFATINGVKIQVRPMAQSAFQRLYSSTHAGYSAQILPGQTWPRLRAVVALPNGETGGVFDIAESAATSNRLSRLLRLLAWKDGFYIEAQLKATDNTFPEDADDSIARRLRNNVPEKLAHLLKVLERVRGRDNKEVPQEQGVCIRDGFVRGAPSDQEDVTAFYHLAETQDVYFKVYSDSGLRQDTTLLDRGRAIEDMLKGRDGHTIRKGRREVPGLKFEEWLMALRTDDRIPGLDFTLEANSKTGSAATPLLIMELNNGSRIPGPDLTSEQSAARPDLQKATLSEVEAVTLWDAVTSTLRPRPGAF